jgi:hypothetical protein
MTSSATPPPRSSSAARRPGSDRRRRPGSTSDWARHPRRADPAQLRAVRDIVCRLLVRHYGELIAFGAGWTDPGRQQPVGETGRHEPRHADAIIHAELECALADPDPLRGIAQLAVRLGAAFTLDPAGVTRTKALGSERVASRLRDALPGGESALRSAVWEFMRPMLSRRTRRAEPRRVRGRQQPRIDRRPRRTPRGVKPRRFRRARQRSRLGRTRRFLPPSMNGGLVSSPLCAFGGTGCACVRWSPAGMDAGGPPGRMGPAGDASGSADGVAVGSGAHLSIASSIRRGLGVIGARSGGATQMRTVRQSGREWRLPERRA